jgi:hypothetical protein
MKLQVANELIRLSEVLNDLLVEAYRKEAPHQLEQLAIEGSLQVQAMFVDDYTAADDRRHEWETVSTARLIKAEWDWKRNRLIFDPNDVPEGMPAVHEAYEEVSFLRAELEELLLNYAPKRLLSTPAKRGQKFKYNWEVLERSAAAFAQTCNAKSGNEFYDLFCQHLEAININPPSVSSMKARAELKKLAASFSTSQ